MQVAGLLEDDVAAADGNVLHREVGEIGHPAQLLAGCVVGEDVVFAAPIGAEEDDAADEVRIEIVAAIVLGLG